MDSIEIPEKTFFKIGEVAKLLSMEPYVLRYWETEFEQLRPNKTSTGQRAYQRRDIDLLIEIRTLLYEELFTIPGARRQMVLNRQGELPLISDLTDSEAFRTLELELEESQQLVIERDKTIGSLSEANASLVNEVQELGTAEAGQDSAEYEMMERHLAVVTQERDEMRAALVTRDQRRRRAIGALRLELQEIRSLAI